MTTASVLEYGDEILDGQSLLLTDETVESTSADRPKRFEAIRRRAIRTQSMEIQYVGRPYLWQTPRMPRPCEFKVSHLLSADDEVALFRAMNFAKYRADQLRKSITLDEPLASLLDQIDELLCRADQVRNHLVLTFLNLGASIARQFTNSQNSLDELISEANVTLMRAVDQFDCDRGFRFSTYATHAVRRNILRFITNRRKRNSQVAPSENLEGVTDARKWTWSYEQKVSRAAAALEQMMSRLQTRDQFILRSRYGLGERPEVQSLQSIADLLGVSRERIRQLECRAKARLRAMAKQAMVEVFEV